MGLSVVVFMSLRKRVVADERERTSGVPNLLGELGVLVEYRMLEVGDYLLLGYAVERKERDDFVRSLYSGRIFDQAYRLREVYENPVLIVEGDICELLDEKIRPRAYWGALAALTFEYGLKIFFTPNAHETANLIYTLAMERHVKAKGPIVRKKPKMENLEKMQLLQVSTLPGIGPKLADRMLKHFNTVRKVFAASVAELSTVKGVGRVKANRIVRLLDIPYKPSLKRPQQLRLDTA